ncbi:50S ribosomal protein L18 [Blastopirellula sp. JC732]|uniref:Large ribosomal subunit protein uL18 n=1 Tax=Blastopirellula sediminis TaxID=2894196 RepID=A0A9X1SGP6_9BACT|nr:50S ribosomal protein L18 [Blastopirellula sediminis]MCC9607505.1 50S ribosomal protein L18 [Blastopirellula sediminis]MCC9629202.1 50S ribosomal protein L18 [Blastopirellula sediminis]
MNHEKFINKQRLRRRRHNRKKVRGTAERPRLTVFRANANIYCQLIDDERGVTLASASTRDKDLRSDVAGGNCDAAASVGKAIAGKAAAAGITQVCFDRGHYRYIGRLAALADAAREAGLQF